MNTEYPRVLQRRIEQMIVDGRYAMDQAVTVDDLASEHQAPLGQVRQVLLAAYRKGLVDKVGKEDEAFRILGLPIANLASVFTHAARSGLKPRSLVRQVVLEPATLMVAEKLNVDVASPVYQYVRTRYVDERALANQTNFMSLAVCPGLEHDDVSRYSFQKLLEEKYYAVVVEMKESFRLVPATEKDRQVLDLAHGASVLVVERVALSATGWPLVWANIRIRPDRYEYVSALWPQAAYLLKDNDS